MNSPTHIDWSVRHRSAFTLLEMLTSMAILAVLVGLLFTAFNQANKAWTQGENRVETFVQARAALDFMSKELMHAYASTNVPFLANPNSIAFVSPVGTPSDGADLLEVVYRLSYTVANDPIFTEDNDVWPKKLVRRASAIAGTSGRLYYYGGSQGTGPVAGSGNACSNPWDFYNFTTPPLDPSWPETGDPNRTAILAENIVSLYCEFSDGKGNVTNIWNSTANPLGRPWRNEIRGVPGLSADGLEPGTAYMLSRPPATVQITLDVLDSRTVARLTNLPVSATWTNVMEQGRQTFSTFVSVPNGF